VLLRGLYAALANITPTGGQSFRNQFQILRQKHATIAIPDISPKISDLVAAEYQEALDDLLSFVESGFNE
jgi:hypothetical protein